MPRRFPHWQANLVEIPSWAGLAIARSWRTLLKKGRVAKGGRRSLRTQKAAMAKAAMAKGRATRAKGKVRGRILKARRAREKSGGLSVKRLMRRKARRRGRGRTEKASQRGRSFSGDWAREKRLKRPQVQFLFLQMPATWNLRRARQGLRLETPQCRKPLQQEASALTVQWCQAHQQDSAGPCPGRLSDQTRAWLLGHRQGFPQVWACQGRLSSRRVWRCPEPPAAHRRQSQLRRRPVCRSQHQHSKPLSHQHQDPACHRQLRAESKARRRRSSPKLEL
mmetsp:Transcript_2200/g.6246  ORF Transcript_2200/g.6246 Transcript_2200/m.6246 type:complete len:279 (-) Transcript_2200:1319-2155(-)